MQSTLVRSQLVHPDRDPGICSRGAEIVIAHDGSGLEIAALALLEKSYSVERVDLR